MQKKIAAAATGGILCPPGKQNGNFGLIDTYVSCHIGRSCNMAGYSNGKIDDEVRKLQTGRLYLYPVTADDMRRLFEHEDPR
jgi:hypothetical protein